MYSKWFYSKTTIVLAVVFFFTAFAGETSAQRKFTRVYPAGQDVKLRLLNRTGTVVVEGWNRPEIAIEARMDPPSATVAPQSLSGLIDINLVRDNQGRDVGDVNFTIRVPFYSKVDIETRIGNLTVSNIRSSYVRAHISSEGDITLTNIAAIGVAAENGLGDIFFDGEIMEGGTYRISSMKGNIGIRIPFTSSFKLVATAPSSRSIALGAFASSDLSYVSNGRQVIGKHRDGAAYLIITNQRGSIGFISR
jgi:hypothetical protein